jgi:hypothetical protein
MKPHKLFAQFRPHVGDKITGASIGFVTSVDGAICHMTDGNSFIWCFRDGLNALHHWKRKAGGKLARCPGVVAQTDLKGML